MDDIGPFNDGIREAGKRWRHHGVGARAGTRVRAGSLPAVPARAVIADAPRRLTGLSACAAPAIATLAFQLPSALAICIPAPRSFSDDSRKTSPRAKTRIRHRSVCGISRTEASCDRMQPCGGLPDHAEIVIVHAVVSKVWPRVGERGG